MISARLILSGFSDAATNMAVDDALFSSYKEGVSTPTLRLYGWKPAAISIGYNQNAEDLLNLDACSQRNIAVVRRPTGGGIIFHDREVTYSIVLAQSDIGLSWRIKESFEAITSFLLECYRELGAGACFAKDAATPDPRHKHTIAAFCFSRNEDYDILVNGKKLGGNAQKRRRNVILQHGSIPLSFDKTKAAGFLKDPSPLDALDVTCVHEAARQNLDFGALCEALTRAFSFHFKTVLKSGALSAEEQRLAEELKNSKYSALKQKHYANVTTA